VPHTGRDVAGLRSAYARAIPARIHVFFIAYTPTFQIFCVTESKATRCPIAWPSSQQGCVKSLAIATAARRALLHLARNDRVSLSDRYGGTICPRAPLAPPVSA